ncbi:MAG: replicative DNA helicase [Actinobacteria bacterium]|nr:replicative DNA helicase [Actinomycetota bacterium]MBU1943865.1 replicative DNA helicase [Actinomycetota bacterium]MBU2687686.1 replicative DNA helicase [Actinomycetota bacterium]
MAVEPLPVGGADRMPPHNLEAEESVLGAMMISPAAVGDALQVLVPEDFFRESHRTLFRVISELFATGKPSDPVVVAEELKRRGLLEAVGDRAYIYSLVGTTPNPRSIRHYAEIVQEAAFRRSLSDAGYEIANLGFRTGEDVAEVYDRAEDRLFKLGQRMRREGMSHIREPMTESFDRVSYALEHGSKITGLPTGFSRLDDLTGGLQPANLIVVGGRTAMGKTSFALNIAHHAAVHLDKGVLIFSLEMTKAELAQRFLLSEARLNIKKLGRADKEDIMKRVVSAAAALNDAPIYIDDTGDITILEMRSIARQLMAKQSIGLVIVDYMQLMYAGKGEGRRFESRAQEVGKIARDLKATAMDLKVPVIAVSQLRRPPAQIAKKEPSLEDLKESGGIEQNADMVMLIYRRIVDEPENKDAEGIAEIHLAKNRNGQTGKFKLAWIGEYTKFEELAEEGLLPE